MKYLVCHEKETRGTFDFPIELYYVNRFHPRYEMPFHWHMECELILVLQGLFELSLDGKPLTLRAGESAFIPEGVVHGGIPRNCVYECLVFDMERFVSDGTVCRRPYAELIGTGMHINGLFPPESVAGGTVKALFDAVKKRQIGYEFTTTGLLWQLIGIVLREGLCSLPTEEERRNSRRAMQMKNALRRIRTDYASVLTLEQLAEEASMVPQYFCRVFRQVTGRTPVDYLNYYRIECAAELLLSTQLSVTEIALQCGFNDISYFSKLFRKYKDVSANAFRKEGSGTGSS